MTKQRINIVVTEPLGNKEIERLEQAGNVIYSPEAWKSLELLNELLRDADVLITRRETILEEHSIQKAIRLKHLVVLGSGTDHLKFDTNQFEGEIIRCIDENARSVAEFSVMTAIMSLRNLSHVLKQTFAGEWDNENYKGNSELPGKNIAIFGAGAIGLTTARLFSLMGANVQVVRKSEKPLPLDILNLGIKLMSIDEALEWADVISVHIPGDASNTNLFNYEEFKKMKSTAHFINTGRGGTVNIPDLLKALHEKLLSSATLDVLPDEPPSAMPLHERLTITPHIAGVTNEAVGRVNDGIISRLLDSLSKQETAEETVYKKSKYLTSIPDTKRRRIVSRMLSREYAIVDADLFKKLFQVSITRTEVLGDPRQLELFEKALKWKWLVPQDDLEQDLVTDVMNDERETEVGTYGLWEVTGDFFTNFMKQVGLERHHYLLDVGCGNLRVGNKLISYLDAERYTGFEKRAAVLRDGEQEMLRLGLGVKAPGLFVTDNFFHKDTGGYLFDFILAAQVLYHLEDHQVKLALERLKMQLKPGCSIYANVQLSEKKNPREDSWKDMPFIIRAFGEYEEMAELEGMAIENLGLLSDLGYPPRALGAENHMLKFTRPKIQN